MDGKRDGGPKFYHCECYDAYHLDFEEDGVIRNGLGNIIEDDLNGG